MKQPKNKKKLSIKKIILYIFAAVILFGVSGLILLSISNRNLPTTSTIVEHLSETDKARLEEFYHLHRTLGREVWPGWDALSIPVIVYNEQYVFLVNYPGEPPTGWMKMPSGEQRGSAWEVVTGDTFNGDEYYRQKLDPARTPENFTVKVGDTWVATLYTYEYAAIEFYKGFSHELPGFIRSVFPYRTFWKMLIPNAETYVAALAHESFHAYQGVVAFDRFTAAEQSINVEDHYPWDNEDLREIWQEETDLLYQAVMEEDMALKEELVREFLNKRTTRRTQFSLSLPEIEFERQREWLEGMAKYAEISIQQIAATEPDYQSVSAVVNDTEFDDYHKTEKYVSRQIAEVTRMAKQDGEIRFYYTGMCMGLLLDDLSPGWKGEILATEVFLEQLLREAVQ